MVLPVLLEPVLLELELPALVWMVLDPVSLGQGLPVLAPDCLAATLSLLAELQARWPVCLIPS